MSLMLVVSMVAWFSYSQLALQCCSLAQRSKQAFLDIGHIDGRLCKNPLLSYKPCVGPCEPIVIAFAWLQAQQQAEQAQQEAARALQDQQAQQAKQAEQAKPAPFQASVQAPPELKPKRESSSGFSALVSCYVTTMCLSRMSTVPPLGSQSSLL